MKQASFSKELFPKFTDPFNLKRENSIHDFIDSLHFSSGQNHFNFFQKLVQKEFQNLLNTKTIIVGGTNGKGEVSYTLGYFLTDKFKTAIWSSPHLLSIRERFCVNGEFISYTKLEIIIKKYYQYSSKLNYYEFLFFIFLKIASLEKLDYLILEVGVGGRLDATNTLEPYMSLLTNISRDHQQLLGHTFKKILNEKIRISRPTNIFITSTETDYLNKIILVFKSDTIGLVSSKVIDIGDDYSLKNKLLAQFAFNKLMSATPTIDSIGKNSRKNLLAEVERLDKISIWGRRIEINYGEKKIIFIGAHNLDGVRSLFRLFKINDLNFDKCFFGYSRKSLSELQKITYSLLNLKGRINEYFYCKFNCFKILENKEIDQLIMGKCEILDDWKSALLSDNTTPEKILITGSYYFIGEVLALFFDQSSTGT